MAARLPLLLPAIALVLSGCAGDSHGGHGEPSLLLGVANELDAELTATWTVTAPNGTTVWQANATIQPTKTEERQLKYREPGAHEIRVDWGSGNGTVSYTPTDCQVMTHIVLTIAPEGLSETKRECHD